MLADQEPASPAGGVVVAAVWRDEAALYVPKLVDVVALEVGRVEWAEAAAEL